MTPKNDTKSFTSWWIDNYLGCGQTRNPPTFPYPIERPLTRVDILAEMNAKLARC